MDLFNKVHIFELMKSHIYEPNISLISLFSLMLNYVKPRILVVACRQMQIFFRICPFNFLSLAVGLHPRLSLIQSV